MDTMNTHARRHAVLLAAALMLATHRAHADDMANMPGMDMPASPKSMDMSAPATSNTMPTMQSMSGNYGSYAMSRESSGTSWQPDSTPHEGLHIPAGDWMLMLHGYADGIYDNQGGRRGSSEAFSESMLMLMAQHAIGNGGTLGLRAMVSLDPLMGPAGYPLLFATGETKDGHTPLIDRQHPHNLFMELSASYSQRLSDGTSVFLYGGLPGEPALGPPAFMHRLSGMDNPEAPITHHWLDSTHITNGVITTGLVLHDWKVEASAFNGREPNQHRYDINPPKLDSASARLSWNPAPNWSLQTSYGYLKSPEQITPNVHENRITASASYTKPFHDTVWATTAAWGRKINSPGHTLDGFLLESELILHNRHTIFARAERVDEDELFATGTITTPTKFTLGAVEDFPVAPHLKFGVGALVSRYIVPSADTVAYGNDPTSFMVFVRLKLS